MTQEPDQFPPYNKSRWCRSCIRAYNRERRKRLPQERAAQVRKYRTGYSADLWNTLLAEQGGLCFICKQQPADRADHCHRTGLPRRPLCHHCNTLLGMARESVAVLEAAAAYLRMFNNQEQESIAS